MPENNNETSTTESTAAQTFEVFKAEVLTDYRMACESREVSLLGRKEVLTGKAKFGIFGDGKEIPQLAMAKVFQPGDFRSGYYRDQTFMATAGLMTWQQFFAQLYSDTNPDNEPMSAGRQMNAHFATRTLNDDGSWMALTDHKNVSADTSPTSSQMGRAVGLAMASKYYRANPELKSFDNFSKNGNEVCFATIGDASTSEGLFWESLNAAGVTGIPLAVSIWDDGYGISVPIKYQTTKGNISELLEGFRVNEEGVGYDIYVVDAWDYDALIDTYVKGVKKIRETHIPAIFHIRNCTQPQGHSTSGSHERYKSKERLEWEVEFDGIKKMREWVLEEGFATAETLDAIQAEAKKTAKEAQKSAWGNYTTPIKQEIAEVSAILEEMAGQSAVADQLQTLHKDLTSSMDAIRRDVMKAVRRSLWATRFENISAKQKMLDWKSGADIRNTNRFNTYLHSESAQSAMKVPGVKPVFGEDAPTKNGFEILNACFDAALQREPLMVAFGEDLGKIGDVNQGFAGLQDKHGEHRVWDTGIREATIIGQGIGMAMRGLRPIAEIQYLDYLIFGLQPLTDDLATVQYRTKGGQKAPLIIRTRGHRLEGIWHTGSPIGMILNSLRGIFVCVPRNMTQAAGFYNLMLKSDDAALIIECLNGYRLKEKMPDNIGEFTVPLGIPEVLNEGEDVTIVTYGSCVRIAQEAIVLLEAVGISCELIDVQTLLPFDINHSIIESLKKTGHILFFDEDVPGGASAYMMQKVIEEQGGFYHLDTPAKTLTAKPHRVAYASDGDYFCKPGAEDVFDAVYEIMNDVDPGSYPEYQ